MVCFHSEYLYVEYYASHGVLISQWYGRCSSRQYRDAMILTADIITKQNVHYFISDRRLLPSLAEADAAWTFDVFLKIFCALPLSRFAVLDSFDKAARQQTQRFLHHPATLLPFEVRIFEDLTSAYDWLISLEAA
ncbi:hypothetical protein I2I11_18500 [Pontibacter sp. 172403-2]|uniref:hypothetical protein n=1 Tax=Pontibacter rufus TaxID=2791028 RepID=UPI0018AF5F75|nr:hypothetical protein [Pontibacter sp. 172403-2]MBF9255295.1 hypothetical protein [Pontibacter sp. 172403-2]